MRVPGGCEAMGKRVRRGRDGPTWILLMGVPPQPPLDTRRADAGEPIAALVALAHRHVPAARTAHGRP